MTPPPRQASSTAGWWTRPGSPPATIELMKKLADQRALRLRVWMMLREPPDRLAVDLPKYRMVGYGDNRLTVRGIKRAVDGALGSRGAWMLEPYADLATSGMNTDSLADVRMIAELAIEHRLPTMFPLKFYVEDGGLMSYGVDFVWLMRRGAGPCIHAHTS